MCTSKETRRKKNLLPNESSFTKNILLTLVDCVEGALKHDLPKLVQFFWELVNEVVTALFKLCSQAKKSLTSGIPKIMQFCFKVVEELGNPIGLLRKPLEYCEGKLAHLRRQEAPSTIEMISTILEKIEELRLEDVCDTIGRCVSAKLRRLPRHQRHTAEMMILKVFQDLETKTLVEFL